MKDTQLALRCNELLGCSLIENAHAGFLRSTAGRQHDSPNLINEQSERQRRAFVHFTQYDFSNPFQLEQPNAGIERLPARNQAASKKPHTLYERRAGGQSARMTLCHVIVYFSTLRI